MNNLKRIIVTSISCILLTCLLIYAEPIKFELNDGTLWQGDTDTEIKLITKSFTKFGNIVKVTHYHIEFREQSGKIIMIDKLDIRHISNFQVDIPTPLPLNQPSKTEEQNTEETVEKLPIVYTIPLTGQVGFIFKKDDPSTAYFSSKVVGDCFVIAKRKKVEAVILDITSNGGYLKEANKICNLIQEYRNVFEIIAYPRQVNGPACGIVMTCDTVVVSPNTKFGPDPSASEKNHLQMYCRDVNRETSIAIALEKDKSITYDSSELVKIGFASRAAQSINLVSLTPSKHISLKNKVKAFQRSSVKTAQRLQKEIDLIWSETYDHKHRLALEAYCLPWTYQIPDKFTISEMMDELMCREKIQHNKSERYVRDSSVTGKNIRKIIFNIRTIADRIVKGNTRGNYPFQLSQSSLCIVNTAAKFGEEVLEGQKIIDDNPRSVHRVNILLDQFTKELKKCKK